MARIMSLMPLCSAFGFKLALPGPVTTRQWQAPEGNFGETNEFLRRLSENKVVTPVEDMVNKLFHVCMYMYVCMYVCIVDGRWPTYRRHVPDLTFTYLSI